VILKDFLTMLHNTLIFPLQKEFLFIHFFAHLRILILTHPFFFSHFIRGKKSSTVVVTFKKDSVTCPVAVTCYI